MQLIGNVLIKIDNIIHVLTFHTWGGGLFQALLQSPVEHVHKLATIQVANFSPSSGDTL